jgi:hypothetical protein
MGEWSFIYVVESFLNRISDKDFTNESQDISALLDMTYYY